MSLLIDGLKTFLTFPSISADSKKKEAVKDCAMWLLNHLKEAGLQTLKLHTTKLHPIVYSEHITHPSYKTILFYGHYDLQPVDPISRWKTPPFDPVIEDNYIFGRGASDDKGQLFIHIKAVEKLIKTNSLPVNVKFLIEGAEEIGSVGLQEFIFKNKQMLKCDAVVVSDTKMVAENIPAITYSLRGALNAEIKIQTSAKDLHSGTFGGSIPNATIVLSNLLSSLHNSDSSIAIRDFYNDVVSISSDERNFMMDNGPGDDDILRDAGTDTIWGEKGYSLYEKTTIRPSLSITGMSGGYQGEGVKNVIPYFAEAKLNFRLAAGQKPKTVQALLNRHIRETIPAGTAVQVKYSSPANPVCFARNNKYINFASEAYEKVFNVKPRLIRSGGTIPAVDFLHTILRAPVVLMGFAQASDSMHAPNEKFFLPNFFRGIETSMRFMQNIAQSENKSKFYHAAYH